MNGVKVSGKRRRAWAGEFGVIVIGVLVALGVDDARQFIADRSLEADLLLRMTSDLESDADDLRGAYLMGKRRLWLYEQLIVPGDVESASQVGSYPELEVLDATRSRSAPPSDSIGAPLAQLVMFPEFDLSDDTYVEMGSTGSLQIVRDTHLRSQILAYYRVAENVGADARWAADHYERLESALLSEGIAIADRVPLAELKTRVRSERMQAELRHARARTLTLFFFLVALELRRELVLGELNR